MPTGDRRTTVVAKAASEAFPHLPATVIADALGLNPKTILRHRPKTRPSTKRRELPVEEIAEAYRNKASLALLARTYRVSTQTIRRRLDEAGIELRSKEPTPRTDLPLDEIALRRAAGCSIAFLAGEYGCSETTLKRRLRRHGTLLRSEQKK